MNREVSKMNCNTQNAKIASITGKTLSTAKSYWSSAILRRGSRYSKHGWRTLQKSTARPLWFPEWNRQDTIDSPWGNSSRTTEWNRCMWSSTMSRNRKNRTTTILTRMTEKIRRRLLRVSMRDDYRTLIYQAVFMQRSEAYRTCASRHRRSRHKSKTGLPDGSSGL